MLSMQKFSSNVIEKCMDRASEEVIVKYVHELADPAAMRPLLQVQYTCSELKLGAMILMFCTSFHGIIDILLGYLNHRCILVRV